MTASIFRKVIDLRKYLANVFNVTSGHDHDGVNSKLIYGPKTHIMNYQIETLSAGVDIADRVIASCPTGFAMTLVSASIIPQGDDVGIDGSNTCAVVLKNGSNAIVTKTYTTDYPDAAAIGSLGTLSTTYKVFAAGEKLSLSVTNGSTANPPAAMLQIVYSMTPA